MKTQQKSDRQTDLLASTAISHVRQEATRTVEKVKLLFV